MGERPLWPMWLYAGTAMTAIAWMAHFIFEGWYGFAAVDLIFAVINLRSAHCTLSEHLASRLSPTGDV